jgi:hypothetical protein
MSDAPLGLANHSGIIPQGGALGCHSSATLWLSGETTNFTEAGAHRRSAVAGRNDSAFVTNRDFLVAKALLGKWL